VRRALFEALGGFDESFFMVYEDVDLSYRARLAGAECLYVPAAVVHHAGSGSLGRESATAVYYGQRNLEWVWAKNTPARLLWRSALAHAVYSLAGMGYYATRGHGVTCVRAKAGALRGLPGVMARRRRTVVSVTPDRIAEVLERHWFASKRREKHWVA
jgi:GT2 family glycosyltransferase